MENLRAGRALGRRIALRIATLNEFKYKLKHE